ncbi:hypothetical protein NM688_g2478 [Phlebia brevispora]|uniref:Uncharacterized protein n=1 Tax=Phlebia brevispora TaxID=194682 RepID=A0ACC1T8L9_9APHY|nr:hypothetical protein NM688_g2478 [Phlebia brevispora]
MTGSHNGILTVSVERLIGPPHIANLVLSVFFGVTIVQVHVYVKHMKRDNVFMRYLILLVWALNAFHFFLVSSTHYYYVIENFGHAALLRCTTWRASAASDLVVRGIFTYRLWKFSQNNITLVTFLDVFLILVHQLTIDLKLSPQSTIEIYSTVRHLFLANILGYGFCSSRRRCDRCHPVRIAEVSWEVWIEPVPLCPAVLDDLQHKYGCFDQHLCDLLLGLRERPSRVQFILFLTEVQYATMRSNYVYDAFYWMLPTLYFNALLATLNARKRLRESLEGQVISLPTIVISAPTIPPSVAAPAWHESFRHEIAEVPRVLPRQRPLSSFSLKFIDAAMDAIALAELGKGVSSPMLSGHVPSSTAFYNL